MITKNFKQMNRMLLMGIGPDSETSGVTPCLLRVTTYGGWPFYVTYNTDLRIQDFANYTSNPGYSGITFGSGTTPPTEDDYRLEAPITGGLSVTRDIFKTTVDNDKLSVEIHFSVTNVGTSPITISEIGLKKPTAGAYTPNLYGTLNYESSNESIVLLIDRTVLDTPVTIPVNGTVDLKYILSVDNPAKPRIINGINCVPFETGSDADIAAMIDAAHSGVIDLQSDGGWKLGDKRAIPISRPASDVDGALTEAPYAFIQITSFEDYNNCGCVMQFDFVDDVTSGATMPMRTVNNISISSYTDTVTHQELLPMLVSALPDWLSTRLLPFSINCLTISGTLETVSGNKLSIRGLSEAYPSASDKREGPLAELYKMIGGFAQRNYRRYATGRLNDGARQTYSRRLEGNGMMRSLSNDMLDRDRPTYSKGYAICPFGCL